jgi:hypothetical protein
VNSSKWAFVGSRESSLDDGYRTIAPNKIDAELGFLATEPERRCSAPLGVPTSTLKSSTNGTDLERLQ